jgi:hypothetical protein
MIGYAIFLVLFGIAAYSIHQSSACLAKNNCQVMSETTQNFLFAVPVLMMVYEVAMIVAGPSITGVLLRNPAALAALVAFGLTLIVWSVLVLQYSAALRSCKCPETVAEDVAYSLAVLELVTAALAIVGLGYLGVTYARMSPRERKTMAAVVAAMSEAKKGA